MKIIHLISTMHRQDISFLEEKGICQDVLVVNQADEENDRCFCQDERVVRMRTTRERGLSNSRNMLLDHAQGDIGIMGDDDIVYLPGYEKIICQAYERHPDADIITFRFSEQPDTETRQFYSEEKRLNLFHISKVASVEVTFRVASAKDRVRFCPLLGLGARFGSGEENAFLADALRAGLRIYHVPKTICYSLPIPEERIKWRDGYDEDYFIKKGACFYRIYGGALFLPFSLAFLILKKRNIFRDVKLRKAISWMLRGKRLYKQAEREQLCS